MGTQPAASSALKVIYVPVYFLLKQKLFLADRIKENLEEYCVSCRIKGKME